MEGCPCYDVLESFPLPSGAPVLPTALCSRSLAGQVSVELVRAPKFTSLLKSANTLHTVIIKQYAVSSCFTLTLLFTVPPATLYHQNNFSFSEWQIRVSWHRVIGLPAHPLGTGALNEEALHKSGCAGSKKRGCIQTWQCGNRDNKMKVARLSVSDWMLLPGIKKFVSVNRTFLYYLQQNEAMIYIITIQKI